MVRLNIFMTFTVSEDFFNSRNEVGTFVFDIFEHLMNLIEHTWNVEAAFPFTAFKRQEHFAATVEIAEPFGEFLIFEVAPGVVVYFLEPFETAFVAGEGIAFDHRDESLAVYPP